MYLALDLGSTHFKAGVFDSDLTACGRASHPIATRCEPGGVVEVDAAAVRGGLDAVVRDALAAARVPGQRLRALALTSQAQTFTLLDAGGEPRTPFLSWQDARARLAAADLAQSDLAPEFARHSSFAEFYPGLQVCLLRHLVNHAPGPVRSCERVAQIASFVCRELTGRLLQDDNLAAMSGLYSLADNAWWSAALSVCGLQVGQLPGLCRVGAVGAGTDAGALRFGLPVGLPVVLAGNDQTAGAYGAGLHEDRAVLLTLGTAQVAYVCQDSLPVPARNRIRGPYPGGRFYRMAADSSGGNVINWARGVLAGGADYDRFFDMAGQAPAGAAGLSFAADVPGGQGRWDGIGLHHAAAHFARAVVESLVERLALLVADLGVDSADARFLVAGGGSRQPVWVGILRQRLGAEVAPTEADPLVGAARLARAAVG